MTDQTQQAASVESGEDAFDSRDFYELCQTYRWSRDNGATVNAFEALKKFARDQLPAPAAPAVGAPVASGVLPLPAPAFELTWRDGAYRVSAPGLSAAKCYIADQMHEYAARCMLHAIPAPPAASLREQEDAARWREVLKTGIPYSKDYNLTDEQIAASVDERIAQRLGREKDKA